MGLEPFGHDPKPIAVAFPNHSKGITFSKTDDRNRYEIEPIAIATTSG
jgi:hypothetical protein